MAINNTPLEEIDQIKLHAWLMSQGIRHAASANGGKRSWTAGRKLKSMGMASGFPDLFIPLPMGTYHGLMIELKREKGGKIQPEQIGWMKYLREVGYYADFAFGFEEAKRMILDYLALTKQAA